MLQGNATDLVWLKSETQRLSTFLKMQILKNPPLGQSLLLGSETLGQGLGPKAAHTGRVDSV